MNSGERTTLLPGNPHTEDAHKGGDAGAGRIRCPLCRWEPRSWDRWFCTACKHIWNTFDTGGVCPGCLKQWTETVCLRCKKWSAHSDWYPKE